MARIVINFFDVCFQTSWKYLKISLFASKYNTFEDVHPN
jgi:hypothetical protein